MIKLWTVKAYHGKRLVAVGLYHAIKRSGAKYLMAADMTHGNLRFTASLCQTHCAPLDADPETWQLIPGEPYGLSARNRHRAMIHVGSLHVSLSPHDAADQTIGALPIGARVDPRAQKLLLATWRFARDQHVHAQAIYNAVTKGV